MNSSLFYILLAIVVLAIVASFVANKKQTKPTTLAWLSYAFIFAGILFGAVQSVGYILMAVGGVLAIIDIFKNQPQKNWKKILLMAGVAFVLAVAIGWLVQYFYQNNLRNKNLQLNSVACTQEAKICPDGTAVGRSGPNCEFAACPTNAAEAPAGSPPATATTSLNF